MEQLFDEFNKFSINSNECPKEGNSLLFVDGHNITSFFFNISSNQRSFWDLESIEERVQKFVEACKKSAITVSFFYDFDHKENEDLQKWMRRREKEVVSGGKRIPTNLSHILAELLEERGVEVHFTGAPGNDIILASYAQKYGANVLSRDHHLLMFQGATFKVYDEFLIVNGAIQLKESPNVCERSKELLKTLPVNYKLKDMFQKRIELTKILHMGCSSPLIQTLGNPYYVITPLRQALYHKIKIEFPVEEVICGWNQKDKKVVWNKNLVQADKKFIHLLDKPFEALKEFFKIEEGKPQNCDERTWENHLFGASAIIVNICNAAYPFIGLVEELKKLRKQLKIRGDFGAKPHPTSFTQVNSNFVKEKIGFVTVCKQCPNQIKLSQSRVDDFVQKGWEMPKYCRECKELRSKKKFSQQRK